MAYNSIESDVRRIIRKTRDTTGLRRAGAELVQELGERIKEESEYCEGSEQKGRLEEAIRQLENAYALYPNPEAADLLSQYFKKLGDVKKASGMPGYEEDYVKSESYAEQTRACRTHRGHDLANNRG